MTKIKDVQTAVETLALALLMDDNYYFTWQSNIAMAFKDECFRQGIEHENLHEVANAAAKSFLSNLTRS